MTAKEYLEQIGELEISIRKKQEKAKRIKESLYAGGISYENIGDARPHNCDDVIGKALCEVADYLQEIKEDTARLIVLRIEADKAIQALQNEKERYVLERHYLFHEGIDKIGTGLGVSRRTVYYYHSSGLKNIILPVCTNLH